MDDKVLEEIRDNQELQLKRQEDALAIQREQFAMLQKQADRAAHLHDRAEQIQEKAASWSMRRAKPWQSCCRSSSF
ncbi:MAG: hypothetical protein ACREV0_14640 [Burkholderiales bacterium]